MMFQIAATKAFSLQKNVDCCFPNFFNHLNYLNLDKEYNKSLNHANEYSSFLKLNTNILHTNLKIFTYPFEFSSFIPSENVFSIDGFFQSEKYFKFYKEEIINLFTPTVEITNIINHKYGNFLHGETLSIHVRRGDYIKFAHLHPSQNVQYFNLGYEYIKNKIQIDNTFIFSDDIEWCKNNLNFKNSIFIENEKDYIELFLMSLCKHNIISNSSFSWWGAWLNKNFDKIVISPNRWFGSGLQHLKTDDIYPDNWIKI